MSKQLGRFELQRRVRDEARMIPGHPWADGNWYELRRYHDRARALRGMVLDGAGARNDNGLFAWRIIDHKTGKVIEEVPE